MNKPTYYFRAPDEVHCYPLAVLLQEAKQQGLNKITLYPAHPITISGFFYCQAVEQVTEDGTCGKQCSDYTPKNKKSGICKYKCRTLYECGEAEEFLII